MLKDTKWIRVADKGEWLDEIKPIVKEFCADKSRRGCVGWNNIVEQHVWNVLKAEFELKTFPKNLYELVRSTFEWALKEAEKKPVVKSKLTEAVDNVVKHFNEMLEKCPSVNAAMEKISNIDSTFVFLSNMISQTWREYDDSICLHNKRVKVRECNGHKYVRNAYEIGLVIDAEAYILRLMNVKVVAYAFNGKIFYIDIGIVRPIMYTLDRCKRWTMFDQKQLDASLLDYVADAIEQANKCITQLNDTIKELEELRKIDL